MHPRRSECRRYDTISKHELAALRVIVFIEGTAGGKDNRLREKVIRHPVAEADAAHAKWKDGDSDFISLLRLWNDLAKFRDNRGRWQRNARVQARAIRNGEIYHLKGFKQVGRDIALKVLGAKLMDLPWLYNGP